MNWSKEWLKLTAVDEQGSGRTFPVRVARHEVIFVMDLAGVPTPVKPQGASTGLSIRHKEEGLFVAESYEEVQRQMNILDEEQSA